MRVSLVVAYVMLAIGAIANFTYSNASATYSDTDRDNLNLLIERVLKGSPVVRTIWRRHNED